MLGGVLDEPWSHLREQTGIVDCRNVRPLFWDERLQSRGGRTRGAESTWIKKQKTRKALSYAGFLVSLNFLGHA